MHSNRYTIIFTMLITMILAFVLSSVYSSLEEQTERNFKADIKKNILSSLGIAPDENTVWTTEDVEAIFKNSVISFVIDKNGDIVEGMLPEDIDPKIDNEDYPIYKKKNKDSKVVVLNGGVEQDLDTYIGILKTPGSGWEHHFKPSSAAGMGAKPTPNSVVSPGMPNPYKEGSMNLSRQMALESTEPELASVLKREAQT